MKQAAYSSLQKWNIYQRFYCFFFQDTTHSAINIETQTDTIVTVIRFSTVLWNVYAINVPSSVFV